MPELTRGSGRGGWLATTAPLRAAIADALPRRRFAVRFWDGTELAATEAPGPTFTVNSPQALVHVVRAPSELGIGRAYVQGLIEVDDLEAGLAVIDELTVPDFSPLQLARLGLGLLRACGLTRPPRLPATELRLRGERHTLARDRRAVRYHYDVGNEFFALFLDPSLTYSCALFSRGATTLAEAQTAKLELIATKLRLRPGERVLDVGCGWGSFAIHAARHHGVQVLGITLAERQAELARQRVRESGLQDQVEIRLADYREVQEHPFDAICSIGMVEHVGEERIDLYAERLATLLTPGGRLLNHGIAKLQDFDAADEGPFTQRFVFPDGVPLPLSRIALALERAGLVTRHVEGLTADYAETLRHWIENYEARFPEAARIAGIERARIWKLYLRAARQGFVTGWTSIYQVLADKPPVELQLAPAVTEPAAGWS